MKLLRFWKKKLQPHRMRAKHPSPMENMLSRQAAVSKTSWAAGICLMTRATARSSLWKSSHAVHIICDWGKIAENTFSAAADEACLAVGPPCVTCPSPPMTAQRRRRISIDKPAGWRTNAFLGSATYQSTRRTDNEGIGNCCRKLKKCQYNKNTFS